MSERGTPGPRIGLALGSGGIRGCAHIGVLKVLVREGIPIHCVAGASAGAVIGAGFAGGLSPAEIERAFLELGFRDYLAFYLDRLRIRRTTGVGRKILDLGSQLRLEDLPIPCALVALDLQRKERVVLRRGPAVQAISAAIAIPLVSGPARIEGRRLYDGGLIDPLPVDLPCQMGAERVIAVDVGRSLPCPPLWFLGRLLKALPPLREAGNLLELLGDPPASYPPMRPDVLIKPQMPGIGPNSFRRSNIRRAIQCGEEAAQASLSQIESLLFPQRSNTLPRV